MKRRVVVTGMGAVTPIGNTVEEFYNAMKEGVCGIAPITHFDTSEYKVKLAAEVKNFDPTKYLSPKEAKRLDAFSQFAIAASREAFAQSGLSMEEEDPYRVGCLIGSGVGGLMTVDNEEKKMLEKGARRVAPLAVPMLISNMAAGNVAMDLKLKGKCFSITSACATATHSIGEAFRSIQHGELDACVTGGAESSITPFGIAGFTSLQALNDTEDVSRASIPFDLERHGFVMGEGAGILVLEELEHAKKRGANILAEIVGYGATCDAYHITSPDPEGEGAAMAMKQAMQEAGIKPEQVEYVNAHATSTKLNDAYETKAIKVAFGEHAYKLAINSTKSMTGHLLGAAGGIEMIDCITAIQNQYVHQTVGLTVDDPECDLDYVKGCGREMEFTYAMSNSLGFGGHNGSLLVKKFED
ncbi:MAG: beta-ketoacyl-ACP synthase II [Clostridiales bacterium]|nr:beta-ketoacyl-ACP synthase II [Clostridiales bacterium]